MRKAPRDLLHDFVCLKLHGNLFQDFCGKITTETQQQCFTTLELFHGTSLNYIAFNNCYYACAELLGNLSAASAENTTETQQQCFTTLGLFHGTSPNYIAFNNCYYACTELLGNLSVTLELFHGTSLNYIAINKY